jgi:hypothetical protein
LEKKVSNIINAETHKRFFNRFEQQGCRIENVIYLAGVAWQRHLLPTDLDEFMDDMSADKKAKKRIFGKKEKELNVFIEEFDTEGFAHWLVSNGKLGILVQFAIPVRQSWSQYVTSWSYGETMEEAVEGGFRWAESMRKSEQRKTQKVKQEAVA